MAKAKKIEGQDENKYRQDMAGARIQREKHGTEENYGWEIDHIFPVALGGTDHIENLQPLQWENNRKKADDFPKFKTIVSSEGEKYVREEKDWTYRDNSHLKSINQ
ncbi:MAG: HNH endonuclease [Dysgonamonadaceae bacterium]|nr:HNH endonuclease [Dysgonamonadaceae bacterium]